MNTFFNFKSLTLLSSISIFLVSLFATSIFFAASIEEASARGRGGGGRSFSGGSRKIAKVELQKITVKVDTIDQVLPMRDILDIRRSLVLMENSFPE